MLVRFARVLHVDVRDLVTGFAVDPEANANYWALSPQNRRMARAILRAMLKDQQRDAG